MRGEEKNVWWVKTKRNRTERNRTEQDRTGRGWGAGSVPSRLRPPRGRPRDRKQNANKKCNTQCGSLMTLGSRPSVSVAHELPPGVLPGSQEPRGKGVRWRGLVACGMSPPHPRAPQESAKLVCGKGWNEDAWDVPCGARCGGTSRVHGPREASL